MTRPVKPRTYDNSGRAAAARETRRAIVRAARELFAERGYVGTTLQAVADRGGVSVQTVYAQFGNKVAIVKQVVDEAIVGDDEPVALVDREAIARQRAEPDPRARLRMQAELVSSIQARLDPALGILEGAAGAEPELAGLYRDLLGGRLHGMREMAAMYDERGELAVPVEDAAQRAAALIEIGLYRRTVVDHGWSAEEYATWLGDLLIASLLPPKPAGRRR